MMVSTCFKCWVTFGKYFSAYCKHSRFLSRSLFPHYNRKYRIRELPPALVLTVSSAVPGRVRALFPAHRKRKRFRPLFWLGRQFHRRREGRFSCPPSAKSRGISSGQADENAARSSCPRRKALCHLVVRLAPGRSTCGRG